MARARGEESEMNFATGQTTPPPRAASTVYFNLDDDVGDVLAARPDRLYEVRPQPGVLRHTGTHFVDFSPVQIHDIPVPQMGVGTGRRIHSAVRRAGRCRAGYQSAEDLDGQDSASSYGGRFAAAADGGTAGGCADDHLVLFVADCRADHGHSSSSGSGGDGGGLPGFRPGQGSPAADVEQIVGLPVPQRRLRSKSSLPGQGSTAYLEHVAGSRARGGPQGLLPGQGSSSSSRFPGGADDGFPGDFRTFFRPGKSARHGPHLGSELGADFTPSTPAPYVDGDMPPTWIDDEGLTWWQSESGRWYKARDPSIWWDDPG